MRKTDYTDSVHLGKKIERVRHLRGMTQTELGNLLGVTKQTISRMERTEKFNDIRLKEIASALGVTMEGLKKCNKDSILHDTDTNNFYKHYDVKTSAPDYTSNHTLNSLSIEETIELFERLIEKERVKFESLKKGKNRTL